MNDELPRGWEWTTLEALAAREARSITDGPFGSNLKTAHYTKSGPRVIRLQNIGDGEYRHEDAHISQEHYDKLQRHSVEAGDLIVASLGEVLPRACLVPASVPPAIVKADCIRVRLGPEVDPEFVNYALQRPSLREETATKIKGVGRPRLGLKGIKALAVPVAPLAEQKRIVAEVDAFLARLDLAAGASASAQSRAHALPALGLRSLFDGAWPTRRIGEIAAVGSGATPKRSEERYWVGGTVPWVSSGAVNARTISRPTELITKDALRETSVKLWPAGTVLMAMYGEGKTRGKVARLDIEATCNQACAAIAYDRSLVDGNYLLAYLEAQYESSRELASGGVQPNLSLGLVKAMEIPLPPLRLQREVALRAHGIVQGARRVIDACSAAERHASALRRSILDAAFSGRLIDGRGVV